MVSYLYEIILCDAYRPKLAEFEIRYYELHDEVFFLFLESTDKHFYANTKRRSKVDFFF